LQKLNTKLPVIITTKILHTKIPRKLENEKLKIENERFNENGFQNECNFPTLYATYIYSGVIHEIHLKRKTIESYNF